MTCSEAREVMWSEESLRRKYSRGELGSDTREGVIWGEVDTRNVLLVER